MDSNLLNNEAFNKLPDEVKEKLKNCKNEEEAMDILISVDLSETAV